MYRIVMLPAAASWVRAVRPALAVGLVVSALGFAAVHGSTDPWLAGYYIVVAVSTGLTAIISGGMEAPIAFHVVNNVLFGIVNDLMAGGGTSTIDRATDTGDASLLILVAVTSAWSPSSRRTNDVTDGTPSTTSIRARPQSRLAVSELQRRHLLRPWRAAGPTCTSASWTPGRRSTSSPRVTRQPSRPHR
jgi:hypothetical protein